MTQLAKIKVANLILFQAGWLACVLGAAQGFPWTGPLAVAAIVLAHLCWAEQPAVEARLLAICTLVGVLFDAGLLATGWVSFPNGWWLPGLAPYWMAAMWLLFATTLNLSMSWLKGHAKLAAVFGAVGGPLAYLGGERLGGIELLEQWPALVALAVGWGVVTPALTWLASKLNGFGSNRLPPYVRRDVTARGATHSG